MKRLLLALVILVTFGYAWWRLDEVPLLVIGQPSSTGIMQQEREAPFFEGLRQSSGVPLKISYKALEQVGFKDTYQLQMLKEGQFDLVSLRFPQNSEAEPGLYGMDMVGLSPDYATARKVAQAYSATVDAYLQERFNSKLLGVWSFGPQEFFCTKPVRRLADLRGLRVRVANLQLSRFVGELGGTPVIISFDETKNALAIGLIDCAVTSAASANYAGWPEHARYSFPLAVHFGLNGYAISLRKWNALSKRQQVALQQAFDRYIDDLWKFSLEVRDDAARCNVGGNCKYGKTYHMDVTEPSPQDVQQLRDITINKLLPEWGAICAKVHPNCVSEWQAQLAVLLHSP
ncbi:MAG: TRAP transporter substrate-binding protein [Rhodoferax sp.]